MKKILILILTLILFSCSGQRIQEIDTNSKINKILELKDIVVNYPENWTYKLDHNSIAYTPTTLNDNFNNCVIHVFKYNGSILEVGPINQTYKTIKELEEVGLPIKIQTRFENTDMYEITEFNKFNDQNIEIITLILHFSHKDDFYILRYRSDKKYFEKYLNDVDFFIDKLEFKNK